MRLIAVLAFFVMFTTPAASDAAWPDKTWPTATPESEGIDSAKVAQALIDIRNTGMMPPSAAAASASACCRASTSSM